MHNGLMEFDESIEVMRKAEELLQDNEYQVDSGQVLRLTKHSQYTAYDCEFVALAQNLGVNLLTMDRKILNQFPKVTLSCHIGKSKITRDHSNWTLVKLQYPEIWKVKR